MQIIPAIDLRGGKCVRLRQGDYSQETVFGDDPAAMARHWVDQGAIRLHVVDLDGAREGRPVNLESIRSILERVSVPCQLGGGIRDTETIEQVLALGLDRVIVGTQALNDPAWFESMARSHPNRLVLGLDAKDGRVATAGWLEVSETPAIELAKRFDGLPLAAIICTDIARDGMLAGPNFAGLEAMARAVRTPIIASGGVTTLGDIARLSELPLAGCIVGRAIYEGKFRLSEALAMVQRKRSG